MKHKFSLEEYLAHPEKKVVTAKGEKVEIVKIDYISPHGIYPVLAVVHKDYDTERRYTSEGYWNGGPEGNLFFADEEPELTAFERMIEGYIKSYTGIVQTDIAAKLWAPELLELARTELTCQGNIVLSIEEFEKCSIEAQEKGRKEALKDLPRWRVSNAMRSNLPTVMYGDNGLILYKDGLEISLSDLEKLPKEDEK